MGIASDITYIVLVALLAGCIAQAVRQPLIIGYIVAGIIVGPHTGGPTVEQTHDIEMLAEVGAALLLFTLGLEFSFGELRRLSRITFFATPIQVVLSVLVFYSISRLFGVSAGDSIWIGAAVALSSTMVVLKTLAARDALNTTAGRIMLAILIAQDVAVIPLMLVTPQIAGESLSSSLLLTAILKSVIFLTIMFVLGTRVFPWLFARVSRFGSRELFLLATLGVALGAGYAAHYAGLSFALGAFVAGMLLSETDFNHQAMSDVASLRDLFGLIFFVSVGMLFDPQFFLNNIGLVGIFTAAAILVKAIITGGVVRLCGYGAGLYWTVGLGLSQVGEFAFVIASTGKQLGQLSDNSYSLVLSTAVVSMVATPILLKIGSSLAKKREYLAARRLEDFNAPALHQLRDHVVIIGGGVVGQYLARALKGLGHPYIVIESDHKTVLQMRDAGKAVVFGDGTHAAILSSAGLQQARLVVIATTHDDIIPALIRTIRELNSSVPVLARVAEVNDLDIASAFSAESEYQMVQPQIEVGLEMVRHSLRALGSKDSEIFGVLAQLRSERGELNLAGSALAHADGRGARAARFLDLGWFDITEDSTLQEQTLRELSLRERFGVSVVAIVRGTDFSSNPGPEEKLHNGDVVGVLGTERQLTQFREGISQKI